MAEGTNSWLGLKINQITYKEVADTLPGRHSLEQTPLSAEREAYSWAPALILPSPLTYWPWEEKPKHYIEVSKPQVNGGWGEKDLKLHKQRCLLQPYCLLGDLAFRLLEVARGFWT